MSDGGGAGKGIRAGGVTRGHKCPPLYAGGDEVAVGFGGGFV